MIRLSLRARLLAGLGAVVVALVVVAYVVTSTTEAYLVEQVDERLRVAGETPRRDAPPGGPRGDGQDLGRDTPSSRPPSDYYVVHISSDGTLEPVFADLPGDTGRPAPAIALAAAEQGAVTGRPFTVGAAGSDVRYRVIVEPDRDGEGFVVTALALTDVDDTIDRLVLVEIVVTAIIVAVLAAVAWWVVRLGIRPIKQMTNAAQQIAAGDRSHRVPEQAPSTEAGQLSAALNHMLDELDESFEQQAASEERLRRFVADASHELRTPVTTIRGYAELYRIGGLPAGDGLDEAMRRTEQEAVRMARLVDDLLTLAKLDEGRPLERRPVDLARLVADAARDAGAVDGARSITTALPPTAGAAVVEGDEDRLRQVIANVVGNALVHTPPGTPIELRVDSGADQASIAVVDHGPGMPPDVAARITQRFYRADPARARHRGGSGLGMSIADAAVVAHGGSIAVDSTMGVGTTVTVTLQAPGVAWVVPSSLVRSLEDSLGSPTPTLTGGSSMQRKHRAPSFARSKTRSAHRAPSFARSKTRSAHRAPSFARSKTRSAHRAPSFARSKTRSAHTAVAVLSATAAIGIGGAGIAAAQSDDGSSTTVTTPDTATDATTEAPAATDEPATDTPTDTPEASDGTATDTDPAEGCDGGGRGAGPSASAPASDDPATAETSAADALSA